MSAFDFGDAVWVKDGSECSVCCFRHMPGCIVDCQNLHPEEKGHYIRPPAPPAFPRPVSSPAIGKIPPAPPADKTTETTPETWMPEARQIAAQCWCDDETKNTEMDVVLAEAIAKRIAAWMDADAQAQRNCDYYRSLVIRCGNALGDAAKTCDDGSKSEDVLCAKVPELVEALVANARGMGSSTAPYPGRTVGKDGYVALGTFFIQMETKHTSPVEEIEE